MRWTRERATIGAIGPMMLSVSFERGAAISSTQKGCGAKVASDTPDSMSSGPESMAAGGARATNGCAIAAVHPPSRSPSTLLSSSSASADRISDSITKSSIGKFNRHGVYIQVQYQ